MEWNKQNLKGALLVLCGGAAFYAALQHLKAVALAVGWLTGILAPFLLGGAIAFILHVPMRAIERHLFPGSRRGNALRRPLALVLTLLAVIGVLGLAGGVIGPGIKDAVVSALGLKANDFVALSAGTLGAAQKTAGVMRKMLGAAVPGHMDKERYEFCWIVDFPMYEIGEESGELEFCHNPFSMPNGGLEILEKAERGEVDPLSITAFQYDLVCNGVELSSGAVRNHDPEIMIKAFEMVRLGEDDVKAKFPAMYNAFCYGAPPHAGIAPGVDRMVMLLAGEDSIREIIPFPMNKNAQDIMMGAPSFVEQKQLDELNIAITCPVEE